MTPEEEAAAAAAKAEREAEKAELEALRKERADAKQAAEAEREKELQELRDFKAQQDKKPKVTPPKTKVEKLEETPPVTVTDDKPKKRRVSRLFGDHFQD